MQTPTRMDKVVIDNYYYMIDNGWKCEVDETSISNIKIFSLNPKIPFCTSTFTSTFLIAFLDVDTRKHILPCVYYVC